MKWQHDFSSAASYTFKRQVIIHSSDDSSVFVVPVAELEFREGISFYPNTRSRFSAYLGADFFQNIDKTDESESVRSYNDSGLNSFFRLSGSYYISPQLRLNFNCNIHYRMYKYGSAVPLASHTLQQGYGLKLTYSMF
jgi:hypothetical protein